MKAYIFFDGGYCKFNNLEQALGGAERELVAVASLLSTKYEVMFYGNVASPFSEKHVAFKPSYTRDIDDADLIVSNNLDVIFNSHCRRYYYNWTDRYNTPMPISDVDLVITDTQRGKKMFEQLGCKAMVLYPLVRLGGFKSKRDPSKILFVGRLSNRQKRPDFAIKAMNFMKGGILHIIGSHQTENKAQLDFIQYCQSICNNRVIWRGELPYSELIKELQSASLVIIPYCDANEFNCNVALEAIANGCVPVIAEGLVDYFHGSEGAFLPQDLTPEMIAEAIESTDTEACRTHGWETAREIWEYCNHEMKEVLLGN